MICDDEYVVIDTSIIKDVALSSANDQAAFVAFLGDHWFINFQVGDP